MNRRNDRAIQLAVLYGCDGSVTVVRDVWDDAAEGVERVVELASALRRRGLSMTVTTESGKSLLIT